MKKLVSIFLLVMICFTAFSFKKPKAVSYNEGKLEVVFNSHLDFNDLIKIKLDLSQKGIVLNYKKLGFDDYGELNEIEFKVDCKDGFSGSASTSGQNLNNKRFGFYRDYSENATIAFKTGALD